MENLEQRLVGVINVMAQISTRGDDTIRMGTVLVELKRIIEELNNNTSTSDENVSEDVD